MAASLNVNDAGTWRNISTWANDSGTWRQITLWVNDAGTWRQLGVTAVIELGVAKNLSGIGAPGAVSVTVNSNGNWTGAATTSGAFSSTWITPTSAAGANYDVKCVTITGAPGAGSSAVNSFLSLGSSRTWQSSFADGAGCQFRIEIYTTSDHVTPLDTCVVTFS